MEFLVDESPGRLEAAMFRLRPDARVTARRVVDEDFRRFVLLEFDEPGQVPLRFALPVELGGRVWRALGGVLPPDTTDPRHP